VFLRRRLERLTANAHFDLKIIEGANHTFSLLCHQRDLTRIVSGWAERFA
jgi:hypothetical protein